ncbi:cytochrome P450 [Nocardioides sp. NPDC023903]|uniref:cytochrome P450 n=1 Tax=Nocardioides sp. NPDC023903 TaxID=3157195 RepID=UPI00340F135C
MTATPMDINEINGIDLFSETNLDNPYPIYQRLREAGGAVWLERIGCWAVTRYAGVRSALDNWETFTSAQGVGMNGQVNAQLVGTVLASDPPLHDTLRGVLAERLSPRAIRGLSQAVRDQADRLVDRVLEGNSFDAVSDLARVFPFTIIADLVGIPDDIRPRVLDWGDGVFNAMGPINDRGFSAIPIVEEQFTWLYQLDGASLPEGSMGRAIYEAADAGIIEPQSAPALLSAYMSASMDTTISSLGSTLMLFAQHPDQWDALRTDRSLISGAFNEALRYESPLQVFTRVANTDVEFDEIPVPAGSRLLMMYGCANRDERHFGSDADRFDITRDAADHLAFGLGLHGCAGQGLARLEVHSMLNALADRVTRFELTGEPVRHINNCVRSLSSLPMVAHVA